jgi:hypothetical protein
LRRGITTQYFHTISTHRSKKNKIIFLDINGQHTTTKAAITQHIFSFYKGLLGIPGEIYSSLEPDFWDSNDTLRPDEQASLEIIFTMEEIKHEIFVSEPNGAPGRDGFTFKFY